MLHVVVWVWNMAFHVKEVIQPDGVGEYGANGDIHLQDGGTYRNQDKIAQWGAEWFISFKVKD